MKITSFILLLIFIFSCKSFQDKKMNNIGENEAIKSIINDYAKYNLKKEKKLIEIEVFRNSENYHVFAISNSNVLLVPLKTDTIGGYTHSFPTNYIKHKDYLFVWNDKKKVLKNDLIDLLLKYNCIDSIHYTNKGEIFIDVKKKQYYFVCKQNISKFKKKKAVWIKPENYPNIKCLK